MTSNHRALEDIDIELIERIKLSPCLYDTRHPDFRLVFRKDYQWQLVSDHLGMSATVAKRRWTVLRDRYARELKQFHLNPHNTDIGRNEFFQRMDFLRKFVKKRRERKRVFELEENLAGSPKVLRTDSSYPFETVDVVEADERMKLIEEESSQEINNKHTYADDVKQEHEEDTQETIEDVEVYEQIEDSFDLVHHNRHDNSLQPSISTSMCQKASMEVKPNVRNFESFPPWDTTKRQSQYEAALRRNPAAVSSDSSSDSDDLFSKVLASYLKNLSRRHKIKAKVEMMQIVEKYIDMEENERAD